MSEDTFVDSDETLEAIVKELELLKIGATHLQEVAARTDAALELSQSAVTFAQQTLTTLDTFGKQNRADIVILSHRFSDEVIPIQVSTNLKLDKLGQSVSDHVQPQLEAVKSTGDEIRRLIAEETMQSLSALTTSLLTSQTCLSDEMKPALDRLESSTAALKVTLHDQAMPSIARTERMAQWSRALLWFQLVVILALGAFVVWIARTSLGLGL